MTRVLARRRLDSARFAKRVGDNVSVSGSLVIIRPGVTEDWETFRTQAPPGSIAADGYVLGPYREDLARDVYAMDHHCEGRIFYRATCAQMQMAILMGMFEGFPSPRRLFVNGFDEDVCVTTRLFRHPHEAAMPRMSMLVGLEDKLDATSGMFPTNDAWLGSLRIAAWLFKPYRDAMTVTGTPEQLEAVYRAVIEAVEARIQQYLYKTPEEEDLNTHYERIGGGPDWSMVHPVGADARLKMFADGVKAYVMARPLAGDSWLYTIGKTPYRRRFPLDRFFARLNDEEGCAPSARWGGSPIVGGSPKPHGSKLPPMAVERCLNSVLQETGLAA